MEDAIVTKFKKEEKNINLVKLTQTNIRNQKDYAPELKMLVISLAEGQVFPPKTASKQTAITFIFSFLSALTEY